MLRGRPTAKPRTQQLSSRWGSHEGVTIRAFRRLQGGVRPHLREFTMIGLVRAASLVAALAFGLVSAHAADKAFKRDDLGDSAIRLEAQLKKDAGPIAKT